MNCKTCPSKEVCPQARYCLELGKPWEPQDEKRTVQADQSWWDKQKTEAKEVVVE